MGKNNRKKNLKKCGPQIKHSVKVSKSLKISQKDIIPVETYVTRQINSYSDPIPSVQKPKKRAYGQAYGVFHIPANSSL